MTLKYFTRSEKGNALFLILIAVALFAALSYAVTQSGRGGGSVDREQALISASQVTQYGAGLRTTITRMIITGTDAYNLDFTTTSGASNEVFDAAGGGAVEQDPPSTAGGSAAYDYLVPTTATSGFYIDGVGTDAADVILIAEDISVAVCTAINRGLGVTPEEPAVEDTEVDFDTAGVKAGATTFEAYDGEAFACVRNATGNPYVYYHALSEH